MHAELRKQVWQRAMAVCEYCHIPQQYDRLRFQIDHVIARQHQGDDSPDNLALACFACNNRKGTNLAGVDPFNGQVVRLFHPRKDVWSEHFRFEGSELIGLTPIGRATVLVLVINARHRVELRQSLIEEGVFPPAAS